jgi:hypothetical protein
MKSKKSHNKKRNVGIIYEQLVKTISESLVNGDEKKALAAKQIIKKYFNPSTELYKEYRLFNSLVETKITDGSLATKIISEAKKAARMHNTRKLTREKSKLIKEINHTINEGNFYNKRVKSYREFATIQTLLNDWRENGEFSRIVEYEAKVHDILLEEKPELKLENEKNTEVNALVVRLMVEKFNKKFGKKLNNMQAEILKEFAFTNGNNERLVSLLSATKESTLKEISQYSIKADNPTVISKINDVLSEIKLLNPNEISDENILKFLTASQLREELSGEQQ